MKNNLKRRTFAVNDMRDAHVLEELQEIKKAAKVKTANLTVEAKSSTIEVRTKCMMIQNVPGRFWAECMTTAAHIINRLPQENLGFISPYEKLWKTFGLLWVISKSLGACATCLCQIIFGLNLTRRR